MAVRALKRMRQTYACVKKDSRAHGKHLQKLSSLKVCTDSIISRAMESHTNEHTVRGRPTLKDVQRFRNGSVRKPNERSIYERTFVSEAIENHGITNELSNPQALE